MIGTVAVYILFGLSVLSSLIYFISYFKDDKYNLIARTLFIADVVGVLFISGYLLTNIINHNFQFYYIWHYSSKELDFGLLLSTFYAGQEGSFLLWSLMITVVGVFLLPYVKKHKYESLVMAQYTLILSFLMVMLITKSPFTYIWEQFPNEVKAGFMPENGSGMNPILENYWMVIHPPILLMGYAALTVPFVLAIAGFVKKEYQNWINFAIPWNLFASGILGLGIMLGGFWAYETLGWGGFWGWDPVENSSLIPWLIGTALLHTLLVQKRTQGLVKTNYILSIATFLLVVYATFLTRSGVLSESSVHSFSDPGQFVYLLLLGFLLTFLLLGLGVLIYRFRNLDIKKINFNYKSKEFFLSLGSILILITSVIVFIGTSLPLVKDVKIDSSSYTAWNLPIAILILLTNAISLYLNWYSTDLKLIAKKVGISAGISLVATIGLFFAGVDSIQYMLLVFSAIFSIIVNLEFCYKFIKVNFKFTGGFLSHFGFSLFVIGALFSGAFSDHKQMMLDPNVTKTAFGYKVTYLNKEQIQKDKKDRLKHRYNVRVEGNGQTIIAHPIVYLSAFNRFQAPFYEPGVETKITEDIYIAPLSVEEVNDSTICTVSMNETVQLPIDNSVSATLLGFQMSQQTMPEEGHGMPVSALVKFNVAGNISIDTLYSEINMETGRLNPAMFDIPGRTYKVGLVSLDMGPSGNMSDGKAILGFGSETLVIDFSYKPYIWLVWVGVIFLVIGYFIAIYRYNSVKKAQNVIVDSAENQ